MRVTPLTPVAAPWTERLAFAGPIAATVMEARERLLAGLARIDGLHLWGKPDLYAVA
jgi:hypothetical protein